MGAPSVMKPNIMTLPAALTAASLAIASISTALAEPGKVRVLNERTVSSSLPDAQIRFENAMGRLSEVLDGYTPEGIKYSNKRVYARDAKKTTLEMDISSMGFDAHWDSYAWVENLSTSACPTRRDGELDSAKQVRMNLSASDALIRDNVSETRTKICAYNLVDGTSVFVATFSVVEGPDRSIITGPRTESLLGKQSDPILQSVRDVAGI